MYIEMKGIGELQDKITCSFDTDSFDLLIRDSQFSHRRLVVQPLAELVHPDKSKLIVKPNKMIVSLHKQEVSTSWAQLSK